MRMEEESGADQDWLRLAKIDRRDQLNGHKSALWTLVNAGERKWRAISRQ